jgi:rod shape-determining protein RodA
VTLTLKSYLRYTSWPIIAAMVALLVFGILAIDASEQADPSMSGRTSRQIIFTCVGLVAFLLATLVPYRLIGRLAYPLFAMTLALLVLVLLVGRGRDDARRWFDLGVVYFQPAEAAKLTYIILLAWYLRFGDHYRRLKGLVVPLALTFVPMALILMEPDLGTALLFLPTFYGMLFVAGARMRHLLGVVALATILILLPVPCRITDDASAEAVRARRALAYTSFNVAGAEYVLTPAPLAVIKSYQVERIEGWLRQGADDLPFRLRYQLRQSKITLGSGGWTGWGNWHEAHGFFRMLPDDHTDFIFAVIGGRWGFLGCLSVLFLYGVILMMGMEIALVTDDPFGRMLTVGVLALLAAQVVINVGMTLGLTPITGMTLPLVSYGGSSLVINCAALGLLINVGQRRPVSLAPKPFEHGRRTDRPRPYEPMAAKRGW